MNNSFCFQFKILHFIFIFRRLITSLIRFFQAWSLYEKGKLAQLVDEALDGDSNTDEACRYMKIGLLCTQDLPKNRPTMSMVAKMLKGEIDWDEEKMSKPGLLTELMTLQSSSNEPHASSSGSRIQDKSSSSQSTNMTYATMTFSSIYDRSNWVGTYDNGKMRKFLFSFIYLTQLFGFEF